MVSTGLTHYRFFLPYFWNLADALIFLQHTIKTTLNCLARKVQISDRRRQNNIRQNNFEKSRQAAAR